MNTRVLQTYGWTPEPVAKLTPPRDWAKRVPKPGNKFEIAIARLTPDWVNWVRVRVQRLSEKIDDLPASSGDQLFYRAHVYTPGKIGKLQAIRNLELLASHLYYILNPSLRPDSTSLDAMDWGQEDDQTIKEKGFLLEHDECVRRHIDQEQDPEAKARLEEARLKVTGDNYDSAFMRSMIISPLVLLCDAKVENIQVTFAVGLKTIVDQAQRALPATLVIVENLLLRQLLLVADGKQTVIDLLRNMHSALNAMKEDLDNVSLEDRQFFANMLNPPELTSTAQIHRTPTPLPLSVPAGAREAPERLPNDDGGTVGEKRKRTTTDKQGLGQGTETSSGLVSSPTKKTCTITPKNIGSPSSPGDDIQKEPDSDDIKKEPGGEKDNYALKSGFGEKGSNDVNQDSGSVTLQPKMDLHDNNLKHKNITTATFELPGVEKTDYSIDILLSLGQLIVSGEFKMPTECDEEGYTARERQFGRFRRTLQLPSGISHTQIEHDLRSGILTIKYPTAIL